MTDKLSEQVRALDMYDHQNGVHEQLADEVAALEIKLAEYENDETARRRADAFQIRTLRQKVGRLRAAVGELAHGRHSGRDYANKILSETGPALAEEEA